MKNTFLTFLLALTISIPVTAEVTPNTEAPEFILPDLAGKMQRLSDFKGKWIVLEWFNKDCPFVKKHYGSNNMQALQGKLTEKGIVWLTIKSSAPGKQGHESPADSLKTFNDLKSKSSFVLIDEKGDVGRLYGAKTTPHMFVINPQHVVIYAGAIDDNDSPDPAVISKSRNYVAQALAAGMADKKVAVASSKPYGCAVKY